MPIYTVRFQETISYSMQVNAEDEDQATDFVTNEIRDVGIEAMNPRIDNSEVEIYDWEEMPAANETKARWYHPHYGLPDSLRSEVLTLARESNVKLAAAFYKVAESTVYRWRKDLGI
tara:strand:+ start:2162 stop:2512 length:351 start_codon:yes stop_codon:yes gene_type:complete